MTCTRRAPGSAPAGDGLLFLNLDSTIIAA
jgi:hypothetical protein